MMNGKRTLRALAFAVAAAAAAAASQAAAEVNPVKLASLEQVAGFFADQLSKDGGYVYAYSPDLGRRRGEGGDVAAGVIWNQPPATPAVGGAFLLLHDRTGDPRWLGAAQLAAEAMLRGQLLSGGWYNWTETDPADRQRWCYRADGVTGAICSEREDNDDRNRSTLDDNITQSALGFLMWFDQVSANPAVEEAIAYGLDRLVGAQFPNGGFPVLLRRMKEPHPAAPPPVAHIPASWSRSWVKPEGSTIYVLNDDLVRDTIRVLLTADRLRLGDAYLPAAIRAGDFLLAAQLPEPQPGWAQTYDATMTPIWGRSFEPPGLASRETAGAIEALTQLYLRTGDARYLESAGRAADWLRRSRRPQGDWARFYAFGTNQPIFVGEDGSLLESEEAVRPGYTWSGSFGIPEALDILGQVSAGERSAAFDTWDWIFSPEPAAGPEDLDRLVAANKGDGAVVTDGWIRSSTFIQAARSLGSPVIAPTGSR